MEGGSVRVARRAAPVWYCVCGSEPLRTDGGSRIVNRGICTMIARIPYRRLMVALAVAALVAAGAGVALAHAKLKSSIPAAGSTVATAPATVTAVFDNHDALTDASSLKVTDASGATVDK